MFIEKNIASVNFYSDCLKKQGWRKRMLESTTGKVTKQHCLST